MVIKTINPRDAYNKDRFVDAMKGLDKLEYLLQGISRPEGNWNPDLRKNLGDLILTDIRNREVRERFFAGVAPDNVIGEAEKAYSENQDRIIDYSKNKWENLLDKVSNEQLVSLVSMLPLVKTENRDYDKLKGIVDEKRKTGRAEQEGGIEAYVNDKLSRAPDWRKQAYYGYSMGDPSYTMRTFNAYKSDAEISFIKAIRKKNGELDRAKLLGLIRINYNQLIKDEAKKAEDKYDEIKDEEGKESDKEKYKKIMSDGAESDLARLYRASIAKVAYESIK